MVFGEAVTVGDHGRVRRVGRGMLLAMSAVLVVTLAACNSPAKPAAAGPAATGGGSGGAATPSASPSAKDPTITMADTTSVSYLKAVQLGVNDGSLTSVQVSTKSGNVLLDGTISGDGTSWASESPPKPSSAYKVVATIKDASGQTQTKTTSFTVAKVPDSQKVSFTVSPGAGSTVGIGEPVVVRFLTPITHRAAIEKVLLVDATTPSGKSVTGSWHWLSDQEVHWRPENFWTPGTKVKLNMNIAGVKAATGRYGRKDYAQTFTIGASHITRVNASTDRAKIYRNGKLVDTWPTATGRHGLETYSGTYIVLGKSPVVQMDSCSARIECDKTSPNYYNEKEYWATRVTASGTFLHAASWDGELGRANTSHGCIHLSDADAQTFYNHAVDGDVVIVSNTGRGPQQRIATQDPGLIDWNLSWSAWKAGSAL